MYLHVYAYTQCHESIKAVDVHVLYMSIIYVYTNIHVHIKNYIHVYLWGTAAVDVPVLCDCHLTPPDRVRTPPDPRMVLGGQR